MTPLVLAALVVAGCANDAASTCEPADYETGAAATVADVGPILRRSCALGGCHLAAPGAGGLHLDMASDAWIDALVGVDAHGAAMPLVTPGDPDASWLAHKLHGDFCDVPCRGNCGGPMPVGGGLTDAERATIDAWIATGAPR